MTLISKMINVSKIKYVGLNNSKIAPPPTVMKLAENVATENPSGFVCVRPYGSTAIWKLRGSHLTLSVNRLLTQTKDLHRE